LPAQEPWPVISRVHFQVRQDSQNGMASLLAVDPFEENTMFSSLTVPLRCICVALIASLAPFSDASAEIAWKKPPDSAPSADRQSGNGVASGLSA
jgi:hypothetical protein